MHLQEDGQAPIRLREVFNSGLQGLATQPVGIRRQRNQAGTNEFRGAGDISHE